MLCLRKGSGFASWTENRVPRGPTTSFRVARMPVAASLWGAVIGRGGETIHALQKLSKTRILCGGGGGGGEASMHPPPATCLPATAAAAVWVCRRRVTAVPPSRPPAVPIASGLPGTAQRSIC